MSLKKTMRHPRFLLIMILLFIYLDYTLHGIRDFCDAYSVRVSVWELLAQMLSNAKVQGCLILIFAFLITDLPGADTGEQYVLVRSGKGAWMIGKGLTILFLTVFWMLIVAVFSCLIVWRIDFSTQWSSAMHTLARTDARQSFSIRMIFSNKVISNYALTTAAFMSLTLNFALIVIGGLWVLLLNFIANRPAGCFLFAIAAFISMSIGGILNTGAIYKISPVSLALLSVIDGGAEAIYPTLGYAIVFYAAALILGITGLGIAVNVRKDYSRFRV